jgi:hypothetical protein
VLFIEAQTFELSSQQGVHGIQAASLNVVNVIV